MLRLTLLLLLLLTTSAFAESWEGEFESSRWPTYFMVHVEDSGGSTVIRGTSRPLTDVQRTPGTLRVSGGGITLDGTLEGNRWSGTLTAGKDTLPFTLTRVPDYPKPKDRLEAWSQDLDALVQRFLRFDRSFSAGERVRFVEEIDALRAELPSLNDSQIRMRMAAAVSLARNAHTRLYLVRNRTELRRLPIRVWWFPDGLYVVRATPEYRRLLGCRIDDIAGTSARHARDVVSAAFAGNPSWRDYKTTYFLTSPEALHGFDITPDEEKVDLGLANCAGAPFRATVTPLPLLQKSGPTESWWDLSPLHADPDRQWVHVLDGMKERLPLYLRDPNRYFWFAFLPESGILYFQYNRADDTRAPEETTKQFAERLLAQFDAHPVKAFVLDLRFNTGGNYGVAAELMQQLIDKTKGMPRYVLTGRATFSAGMSHVAAWKAQPDVTIVGEPIADDLDYWSEGGNIVLPNSRLYAHFANGAHSYSPAPCPTKDYCYNLSVPSLDPDLPVTGTWEEYRKVVDALMETVVRGLRKP